MPFGGIVHSFGALPSNSAHALRFPDGRAYYQPRPFMGHAQAVADLAPRSSVDPKVKGAPPSWVSNGRKRLLALHAVQDFDLYAAPMIG